MLDLCVRSCVSVCVLLPHSCSSIICIDEALSLSINGRPITALRILLDCLMSAMADFAAKVAAKIVAWDEVLFSFSASRNHIFVYFETYEGPPS